MTVRTERLATSRTIARLNIGRFLPIAVLAGYGIFILSLFVRNVMMWYINPSYIVPTTLAGAVLIGLAAVRLARPGAAHACDCEDGSCSCESCEEPGARPRTFAVLALPLVLALLVPPHGLAAFSAIQRGPQIAGMSTIHGAATVKRVSLSVDTRSFSMMDWVGALSADPNPKDYLGKPAIVTGMVLRDPGSVPPGYVMVLRYLITCCIADARPVGVIVKDTSHGALKDNQWVTVTGAMGAGAYQGQKIAVVIPRSIKLVKAGNPYIY